MDLHISPFPKRPKIDLSGLWDFQTTGIGVTDHPKSIRFREQVPVPGVWESSFKYFNYRGKAWYRKRFAIPAIANSKSHRLVFGAVSHTAKVWLDGKYLGEHYGAHTSFEFLIPSLRSGQHDLAVLVDNSFGPHNPLTTPRQDIYMFGGIPRLVYLEEMPEDPIQTARAVPSVKNGKWSLEVDLQLNKPRPLKSAKEARITLDGKSLGTLQISKSGSAKANIPVGKPELWSPENPRLHTLTITTDSDEWSMKIGFREIKIRGGKIYLNGKPLKLRGVNRHEFHPDFGSALPLNIHLRDIEILKKLGANFIRGSHYPNDPQFLSLCDQHGLLFWEELAHWQHSAEQMQSKEFQSASMVQLREMVTQHFHHPCIIMWGMLNEAAIHIPSARKLLGRLAREFKKLDPTRPVTFASNHVRNDLCFDLVDIISINVYPGWYSGGLTESTGWLRDLLKIAKKRGRGKPVILSEFGAAGINGVRSLEDRKWTENYQAELLERLIGVAEEDGLSCGLAIWQYCDARTASDIAISNGRVREYNNKGILTEYREPKMAFYATQRMFQRTSAAGSS
jgi:beta-glucuronidase